MIHIPTKHDAGWKPLSYTNASLFLHTSILTKIENFSKLSDSKHVSKTSSGT